MGTLTEESTIRIAFDDFATKHQLGGVSTYASAVYTYLSEHKSIQIKPFRFPLNISFQNKQFVDRLLILLRDMIYYPIIVPLAHSDCDVLLFPTQNAPILARRPYIVVLHDLSVLHFPHMYRTWFRYYSRVMLPLIAKHSAHIFTDTEFTKQDISRTLQVDVQKITVIPPGINLDAFYPIDDEIILNAIRAKFGLKSSFFLAVGAISPRKNYPRLLKAVELIRSNSASEVQLVIVGSTGWKNILEFEEAQAVEHVKLLGFVEHTDLQALYSQAVALVYPSLYEGFGLPILEAMACGCPVIASNTSSMPEVVGEAGLLCNPYNVESIGRAMSTLLEQQVLRQQLIELGFERVQNYSWSHTVAKLMDVIHTHIIGRF